MTKGIHHITAIASDGQKTIDFYTHVLGLRLVKKTVNQDDVETYHLYFGDLKGNPGMDLTFFIFLPPHQGERGTGLVTTISLAVPQHAKTFWLERLASRKVKHEEIYTRFGYERVRFFDFDNQQLELVFVPDAEIDPDSTVWETVEVPAAVAIRHFFSATLGVVSRLAIEPELKEIFGYEKVATEGHTTLYKVTGSARAQYIEVCEEPSQLYGLNAAGTVHHIAFRAKNLEEQAVMRTKVQQLGLFPTEVIDRFYFKSVYFRTPSGILFEIATDEPGFTADEPEESLGESLALPPFLENERAMIEKNLVPLHA